MRIDNAMDEAILAHRRVNRTGVSTLVSAAHR